MPVSLRRSATVFTLYLPDYKSNAYPTQTLLEKTDMNDFILWGVIASPYLLKMQALLDYAEQHWKRYPEQGGRLNNLRLIRRLLQAKSRREVKRYPQLPDELASRGWSTTVADARFAKPFDREMVLRLAKEHEALITIEEGAVGGFGGHVLQFLANEGALDNGLRFRSMTLPDIFINHDKPEKQYEIAGLCRPDIVATAMHALGEPSAADQGERPASA